MNFGIYTERPGLRAGGSEPGDARGSSAVPARAHPQGAARRSEGLCAGLIDRAGGQSRVALAQVEAWLSKQPKVSGNASQPQATRELVRLFDTAEKAAEKAAQLRHRRAAAARARRGEGHRGGPRAERRRRHRRVAERCHQCPAHGRTADNATAENAYDALKKYARDLTEAAREGKLDPVIGRDEEIRRTIQVLSRRTKNNPVLIGEPGVGKTAIIEGLALRIVDGDVPESLKDKSLLALDMARSSPARSTAASSRSA